MSISNVMFLTIYSIFLVQSECHNILAVFNIPSKSLHLAAVSMVEILAEKGHNVTLVTAYECNEKQKNFTHVFLKDTAEVNEKRFANYFDFDLNPYQILYIFEQLGIENSRTTFEDRAFKKLLNSQQKFDLLIVDTLYSASLLYLSEYYNIPVILYTSLDSGYATNPYVGNPAPPSYVPHVMKYYSSEMSFFQRLDNALISLVGELLLNLYALPGHDEVVKSFFPEAPDINEYSHKASVLLMNSDVAITEATPKTPGMVYIGGFHIKENKPLPEDIKHIMDNAKDGVILFSLGSNIKSSQMPRSRVQEILQVFSKLKQVVIWKWEEEDLPGKPTNVVVKKWLPQNEILAHKNIKLFITHGGQHSILETVFYGVPCVSLSVFMDQASNSFRAVNLGFAEWIRYEEFTPEKFENAIRKTLTDPRYTEMAKKRSKIMRDKPITPRETIAFWVDYVVNHKGANHLKVAALKLSWYQYLLLDVVAFIVIFLFLLVCFIRSVIKYMLSSFCKKKLKEKNH
ncbi:UDP-glycosyltransferase UGT5-like isoform X3 [Harmonia axyridis]|uniref:UDP-glycosyltransferase UGT5-like isoform X3 n=1 Tax=Harmonia axyridis TaxID=115357 RepID=UPI001E276F4D|nr:UDP-glycosyltransferase UGT5-like isoform X3 [Harmonia axyridis]